MILPRLVPLFSKESIPYCIVGGYAVVLHGIVRGTLDLDIITELTAENLVKLENVLKSIGMRSSLSLTAEQIIREREFLIRERNLIAWNFYHPERRTDILDILITEDIRNYQVILVDSLWGKLPVVDVDGLIHIKSKTSREQDKEDVKSLKSLKSLLSDKFRTKSDFGEKPE